MSSFDNLNAPQFSTFDDDPEDLESYFQIDHEYDEQRVSNEELFYTPSVINRNELRTKMRRSVSCGHITKSVPRQVSALDNMTKPKMEKQLTRARSASQSRLCYASQGSLDRLAAPKNAAQKRFVSVAEAIQKFEQQVPPRFHSLPKNRPQVSTNQVSVKLKLTIPQSPALQTKNRIKPQEYIPTQEEREQMLFEEEQKKKFRAHPIKKKIFQPLKAIHREPKITVPEPFKLKEPEPKEAPKDEKYEFHARPIPKSVLEPPKLPEKKPSKLTTPVTPKCAKNIKKITQVTPVKSVEKKPPTPHKRTVPKPFSFEQRDQKLFERKEQMILKVLEEEKKNREFHAKPIPKPIRSLFNQQKTESGSSSTTSLEQNEPIEFKARPPTVLYKKPFEPKKPEHPTVEIQPFQLQSEIRAKEREEFERQKREKEEQMARILKEEEEARVKKTEEEVRKLRKELEFKANPVRQFKEVQIKHAIKVTEPISPTFRSGKSNMDKNKENVEP